MLSKCRYNRRKSFKESKKRDKARVEGEKTKKKSQKRESEEKVRLDWEKKRETCKKTVRPKQKTKKK